MSFELNAFVIDNGLKAFSSKLMPKVHNSYLELVDE